MTATLAGFAKGHEFAPVPFELTEGLVGGYTEAVEDAAIAAHFGVVPPMALAALSVRALLESADLPEGAVHVAQELAFKRAVNTRDSVSARAKIVSRGERAGWVLLGIDLAVDDSQGHLVMSGRATITFPAEASG